MTGLYPYSGSGLDKYWSYKNKDPSTEHYGTIVSYERFHEIRKIVDKRGNQIYGVRPESIIVHDLYHEVVRQLQYMLTEHVKAVEQHELENSGNIENYFDPEKEEKEQNEENEQKEGSGSL